MFQILLIVALFQALFFSMLLITKKPSKLSDKYLSAWLVVLGMQIAVIILSSRTQLVLLSTGYMGFCLSVLHGPFFYLYTCCLTRPQTHFKPAQLFHFLPSILFLFIGILLPAYMEAFIPVVRIASVFSMVIYLIFSLKAIHEFQLLLTGNYSNIDKLHVNWLKLLAFGLLFFCFGASFIALFGRNVPFTSLNELFAVLILLFISVIGFKGIKQGHIFYDMPVSTEDAAIKTESAETDKNRIYSNYGLKQDEALKLSSKLTEYMEVVKPYTNMDLSLRDLAAALDVAPHYITQVLSTVFNQNFYEFVNTYRIEEVRKRLVDSQYANLTIQAIAYDCGFNSKSSFNRIFKQKTNQTPTEYMKSST